MIDSYPLEWEAARKGLWRWIGRSSFLAIPALAALGAEQDV
jgi:hypothetical protein